MSLRTPARVALFILIFLLGWGAGLALSTTDLRRPGGDSEEMLMFVRMEQDFFYVRSPLTVMLHRWIYQRIEPLGFDAEHAMALSSSAAGGLFLVALLLISRHPLFLAFNLISGSVFLFMGHLENYSWVNALLVMFLALLKLHFERERFPLWPAAITLILACLFHMLGVFYLPVLVAAMWRWDRESRRLRRRIGEYDFLYIMTAFIFASLFSALGPMGTAAFGLDNNFSRLVPWFHNPDPGHYFFTFFEWGHWRMLAHFHWMASPLGLIVLIALGWKIRSRFERFALLAAICGLVWTTLWHPDMHRGDWDLFSSFAFPLHVLDGLLLARAWEEWRYGKKTASRSEESLDEAPDA